MTIKAGDTIVEISTGRILTIEGLWGGASKVIDFSAIYDTRAGIDKYGNSVFGGRGFRFADEGVIWEKVK